MFVLQEVLMNIKVPKSTSYKIIAETFGQRYVAINTATVDHIMYRNTVLMEILCKFGHLNYIYMYISIVKLLSGLNFVATV